ncbi:NADH:flavin oxidoreductase/NADH oxidase [Afifella pfennigii]|uniref:NADH:flavin oxidoreductase/NADH oxidase n=1 Tax=Afifella pfennigii TaxID=209897 RepID=UPI00047A2430|nr:NADH:flavin oxidoreductase/NADH oxidase [Afifella pfennigii]
MNRLFSPLRLRELTLGNRILVSPMCQYSAVDGKMGAWHVAHLASLALSGAGLLTFEATSVSPEGRISAFDAGLYDDATEAAMAEVLAILREASPIPLGIQLGHAGRKASSRRPWEGRDPLPIEEGGWQTLAPSGLPIAPGGPVPRAMDEADIEALLARFTASAERADRLCFDYLEVHCGHGYLLSSFLSPLANHRRDAYGGSLQNRMRLPLEVVRRVRAVWHSKKPLGIKINGSDFAEGGFTLEEAGRFAAELGAEGIDLITVSGGGVDPGQKIALGPGYQVPLAEHVRRQSGLATAAVGLIVSAAQAEEIVASGKADAVALARAMLFDPRWPYHAALELGAEHAYPPQYERAHPSIWPGAALTRADRSG